MKLLVAVRVPVYRPDSMAAASDELPSAQEPMAVCVLTGERLFRARSHSELERDGNLIAVRGSMYEGLNALAVSQAPPQASTLPYLPHSTIDLVTWAELQPVDLDKPAFLKRWQRYVALLQRHLSTLPDGASRADRLAVFSQLFATELLSSFDQVEFFTCAGADADGALAVLHYRKDGLTPWLWFLADGVKHVGPAIGASGEPAEGT